jgi:hypothetical protein
MAVARNTAMGGGGSATGADERPREGVLVVRFEGRTGGGERGVAASFDALLNNTTGRGGGRGRGV